VVGIKLRMIEEDEEDCERGVAIYEWRVPAISTLCAETGRSRE
jgi:hypothetical protein